MADGQDFTAQLLQALQPQSTPLQVAGQQVQETPFILPRKTSGKDLILGTAIKSLGGGLLSGLGQAQATRQQDARTQALQQIIQQSQGPQGGISQQALVGQLLQSNVPALRQAGLAGLSQGLASQQELQQKAALAGATTLAQEGAKLQAQASPVAQRLELQKNEAEIQKSSRLAEVKERARQRAEASALGQSLIKARQLQEAGSPKELRKFEKDTRDEIRKVGKLGELSNIESAFQSMLESFHDDSGAADLDFVFGVAKILDPTSVVREGEQQTFKSTGAIPSRIEGLITGVISGQKLPVEIRRELLQVASSRRDARIGAFKDTADRFAVVVENAGANPVNVFSTFPEFKSSQELMLKSGILEDIGRPIQDAGDAEARIQGLSPKEKARLAELMNE